MSELTFLILRIAFLVGLWAFVFSIVYALRSDLFGAPARRMRDRNQAPAAPMVAASPAAAQIVPDFTPAPTGSGAAFAQPAPRNNDLPSAGSTGPARQLLITQGVASGTQLTLDEELVTIGRSPDSTLVIVDEYTSTHHAQLRRRENDWTVTDLDSTNGTRVDGERISGTVVLPTFTAVTIGTTTFELRP